MGIIDLKTNLKSLRYGKDRPFGGSSNQPYVKRDIDVRDSEVGRTGGPDFLLRGGILIPQRVGNDVSRMTQMFSDFKSPNGLLFTAKQYILSRTSVAPNGGNYPLNAGLYLPTSTILQAGGNAIGLHVNKQGINPLAGIGDDKEGILGSISNFDPLGQPSYINITKNWNRDSQSRLKSWVDINDDNNKLKKGSGLDLYEYQGGPGSILGIGKTRIKMYPDYRTGFNNKNGYKDYSAQIKWGIEPDNPQTDYKIPLNPSPTTTTKNEDIIKKIKNDKEFRTGVSIKYASIEGLPSGSKKVIGDSFDSGGKVIDNSSIYEKGNILKNSNKIKDNNTNTLNSKQIDGYDTIKYLIREDFRLKAREIPFEISSSRFDYTQKNIETRLGLNNPGRNLKQKNSYDYTDTKEVLDKLTASPTYTGSIASTNSPYKDIIKFRIGIIDNSDPTKQTFIHFRAFIDSMSDNYTSEWDSHKLMGRGENFYSYKGFDRTISLSWTVPAQSKGELNNMYKKLNYLASSLTPNYSSNGYMRGNLATLTVGDYIVDQPGIIKSINLEIPNESPWNIQIIDEETDGKELPLIIKVSGFSFVPIHKFVPKIEENYFA